MTPLRDRLAGVYDAAVRQYNKDRPGTAFREYLADAMPASEPLAALLRVAEAAREVERTWLEAMSTRDDDGFVEADLWEPWMRANRKLASALAALPREDDPA